MDWIQFATFFIGNIIFTLTLWLWNRSESRQDHQLIVQLIINIQTEMNAIQAEIKDFHGRLCAIEERNKEGRK